MRVGLDGLPLAIQRAGVGHYTFELARALALLSPTDDFQLVTYKPLSRQSLSEIETNGPKNLQSTVVQRYRKWWAIGLPLYLKQAPLDLFHGTNYEVPLFNRRRNLLTIHDLSVLLYPEMHEGKLARRMRRRLPIMARSASIIFTASESIKREVCEHFSVPGDRVVVTPYAPREVFHRLAPTTAAQTRQRLGIENDFILFVGTLEPRKNLLTLARAFDEVLRTTAHRPQLVIAGGEGWLIKEFNSFVHRFTSTDRVRITGYLSDEDLQALYSSCRVFVYPSIYEGFGLPPLEAMACGAAVIASDIPVFRETLQDAALLVNPHDYRLLASAIVQMLEDESQRRRFACAGEARAQKFSWARTASTTLDAYRRVLKDLSS